MTKTTIKTKKEEQERIRNVVHDCSVYAAYVRAEPDDIYGILNSRPGGLSDKEVKHMQELVGLNTLVTKREKSIVVQLLLRFTNPLVVVLLIIAAFSVYFGDVLSAIMVMSMAVISVFLSFTQEYRAGKDAQKLSEMVHNTAAVYRNGILKEIQMKQVVPGDVIELIAGDMIPADMRIVASKDVFVNQSSFTGESFPVEKFPDAMDGSHCDIEGMANIAFMGSSVVSGTARGVVIKTGLSTQFGAISKRLAEISDVSGFDEGIRKLTWLMIKFMIGLVIIIFAINAFMHGNIVEALLFSLAVAVGLTPEMLPMIIALNLSKGAIAMSKKSVIVKHLSAMQNFGSMDILCTDKTGTLTLNKVVLEQYCDVKGKIDDSVLEHAYINSYYQTGLKDLLDRTILDHEKKATHIFKKVDEIPFDFSRKIMSVVVSMNDSHRLICKGAPEEIFKRCTHYEENGVIHDIHPKQLVFLEKEYNDLSEQGFRVLAIAYKDTAQSQTEYSTDDETGLVLKGYLAFLDPPKTSSMETINALEKLGIAVKILTGDHPLVTKKICMEVGLDVEDLMTGDDIETMSDEDLQQKAVNVTVFARLSPLQKERVIHALHAAGHIVGYMGDGINDAPALKASDVGISVNNAVDIAKESADLILLKKSLLVLRDGVVEGRKTFTNILKYIRMGTSSNLGNMISMTGASIFLPFLPMLPIQILLNNFLYDLSQLAIPTDDVDEDYITKPHQWDIHSITRFMIVFGILSSIFDFVTFGLLIFFFHASPESFHTAWFLESLATQTLVIHIIRTDKIPFVESRSSSLLLVSTIFLTLAGLAIPFMYFRNAFNFSMIDGNYLLAIAGILIAYLAATQIVKKWFIKRFGYY